MCSKFLRTNNPGHTLCRQYVLTSNTAVGFHVVWLPSFCCMRQRGGALPTARDPPCGDVYNKHSPRRAVSKLTRSTVARLARTASRCCVVFRNAGPCAGESFGGRTGVAEQHAVVLLITPCSGTAQTRRHVMGYCRKRTEGRQTTGPGTRTNVAVGL